MGIPQRLRDAEVRPRGAGLAGRLCGDRPGGLPRVHRIALPPHLSSRPTGQDRRKERDRRPDKRGIPQCQPAGLDNGLGPGYRIIYPRGFRDVHDTDIRQRQRGQPRDHSHGQGSLRPQWYFFTRDHGGHHSLAGGRRHAPDGLSHRCSRIHPARGGLHCGFSAALQGKDRWLVGDQEDRGEPHQGPFRVRYGGYRGSLRERDLAP